MEASLGVDFLIRLLIAMVSILFLVRLCFYVHSSSRAYATSFILFGMGVFLVTGLLHSADISMGFAFGLFAIFSMLRYRTESISIKEMTYLFLVIAIALLTAVAPMKPTHILALNGFICVFAYLSETRILLPLSDEQTITYEKIENIKPEKYSELIDDLKERTGLNITKAKINKINFAKDTTDITIYYKKTNPEKHV